MRPNRLLKTCATGVMLLWLLTSGLSGCRFFRDQQPAENTETPEIEQVSGPSDLENTSTGVRITVPDGWEAIGGSGLRRSKDLYARSSSGNLYAAVLSESKSVLSQFDLENNAEQYRWLIRQELDSYEGETRTGVNRINGKEAVQYEIRGRVNGVPVVYLHTTVQGTDDYYQVVGWASAESYQANSNTLKEIIESFRGT